MSFNFNLISYLLGYTYIFNMPYDFMYV